MDHWEKRPGPKKECLFLSTATDGVHIVQGPDVYFGRGLKGKVIGLILFEPNYNLSVDFGGDVDGDFEVNDHLYDHGCDFEIIPW